MNNLWKKIVSIACVAILAGGFAWGVFQGSGESAYDLAVKNGFQGTEKEWLASLKGQGGKDAEDIDINDLYEAAIAKGYTGTFLEFLKEYIGNVNVNENNNTEQIAENAMSVVSVVCGFEKKKTSSGGLFSPQTEKTASSGSGVIIDLDKENGNATIVTNFHVVYDKDSLTTDKISDNINVYIYGGYTLFDPTTGKDNGTDAITATYIGGAMNYDIALIQISGSEIIKNSTVTEAKIGDSEEVQIGEKVFPIGNPGGDGIAVTNGLISMTSENIVLEAMDGSGDLELRVMRTDAAINPGNSGGGLFNVNGELIGIVNAKSVSSNVDNVGYAIPINLAKAVWENILDNDGQVKRAMLGVMVQKKSTSTRLENGRLITEDVSIVTEAESAIQPSAAAYGKLTDGDIIQSIKINDRETQQLTRFHHLLDVLLEVRKGDTVIITVLRNGEKKEAKITFDADKYFTIY